MNFKNGDLAVIVAGPWREAIGRVVKIIWRCRERYGHGVSADGLDYWLDGGAPIYLVKPITGIPLPAGHPPGEILYRLKRRPYCGCWMRPLLRSEIAAELTAEMKTPAKKVTRAKKERKVFA